MIDLLRQTAITSDPLTFWLTSLVLAVLAAFALHKGLEGFWRLRLVADTPTAKIRSAPQGYVELNGQALPYRALLNAALTGLPCVWYRYKVEERRRSGKSHHWFTVESGEADKPFLLDDGSGRCVVEPAGAELHCRAKDTWYGSGRRAPKPSGGSWLRLVGRYRMTEERIVARDPIYLLGRFETPRRGEEEKERLTRSLLSAWKRDPSRMDGFDKDGDGEISLGEWERARAEARRVAGDAESRLRVEPPLSRIKKTGDRRRPFVIATLDSDALLRRLRLSAIGGTGLFLLVASGGSYALLARLLSA